MELTYDLIEVVGVAILLHAIGLGGWGTILLIWVFVLGLIVKQIYYKKNNHVSIGFVYGHFDLVMLHTQTLIALS